MTKRKTTTTGTEAHVKRQPIRHSDPQHDYRQKGTYLLTLTVRDRLPLLGTVKNGAASPLIPTDVEYTELACDILRNEVVKVHEFYPQAEVLKAVVFPDSIDLTLRLNEDLPKQKHIGKIIAGFKSGCNKEYWRLNNMPEPPRPGLFAPGYTDKILSDAE